MTHSVRSDSARQSRIIRDDLLDRTPGTVPTIFRYKTHADKDSMFNTPPCFAIYVIGQVCK